MKIFIMRHGEASFLPEHIQAGDAQRPLTERGKAQVTTIAMWLVEKNIRVDKIFVSPYLRAQQTCNILMSFYSSAYAGFCDERTDQEHNLYNTVVQTIDFITPSDNPKDVHDFIDGLNENINNIKQRNNNDNTIGSVLIISHMPLVGNLVAELTHQAPVNFATANVCEIDYDEMKMQGQLIRMITP